MHSRTRLTSALALFAVLGMAGLASAQDEKLQAFAGEWFYVEDRTKDRPLKQQGPPMFMRFWLRPEKDALVQVRSRNRETRFTLDGKVIEVPGNGSVTRYIPSWKDGVFAYNTEIIRDSDKKLVVFIRREYRIIPEGLLVRVISGKPATRDSLALYRHPEDIPIPKPKKATIADVAWLSGPWLSKNGATEERWTPPKGGAMLGLSRTVKRDRMSAFEYLRIIQRDDGLIYVAQPGGRPKTEFVLTKIEGKRVEFSNPRHNYPQKIVYELSDKGDLTAWIGFIKGGTGRTFEFKRDGK